jgi:hypothetical protein
MWDRPDTGSFFPGPYDFIFYDINAQIKNQIFGRDTTTFIDANLLASHLPFANRKSYDLFYYCHKICWKFLLSLYGPLSTVCVLMPSIPSFQTIKSLLFSDSHRPHGYRLQMTRDLAWLADSRRIKNGVMVYCCKEEPSVQNPSKALGTLDIASKPAKTQQKRMFWSNDCRYAYLVLSHISFGTETFTVFYMNNSLCTSNFTERSNDTILTYINCI